MTFTDEDLSMLKERCSSGYLPILDDQVEGFALLARLEAAERVVQAVGKVRDLNWKHHWQEHNKEIQDGWLAWRDAAGK